jgi:hypothetical protein
MMMMIRVEKRFSISTALVRSRGGSLVIIIKTIKWYRNYTLKVVIPLLTIRTKRPSVLIIIMLAYIPIILFSGKLK